jgi:hypothetical protein
MTTPLSFEDLARAVADLCDGTGPVPAVLPPSLEYAHIPRVGRDDGVMRNPGSQCVTKAMRAHPAERHWTIALIGALGQGHPTLCRRIAEDGPEAALGYEPEAYGYRREVDWVPTVTRILSFENMLEPPGHVSDSSEESTSYEPPDLVTMARLCRSILFFSVLPELVIGYAHRFMWELHGGAPNFYQVSTPGPVGLCHDMGRCLHRSTVWISNTIVYPTMFDASALMCEMYRVNRHLAGRVNLVQKRPKRSRVERFGDDADWHLRD